MIHKGPCIFSKRSVVTRLDKLLFCSKLKPATFTEQEIPTRVQITQSQLIELSMKPLFIHTGIRRKKNYQMAYSARNFFGRIS